MPWPHAGSGHRVVIALALLAFALIAAPASAQGVDGVVTFASNAQPVPGVLVAAFDADGARVRAALTDSDGRFALELPAGEYRLVAERIGLSQTTIDGLVVRVGERTSRDIEMIDRPIELEGLVVDSRVRSCRTDARDADRVQRWWSEVRTALGVSSALQEEEFGHFIVERFERVWDEDAEHLVGIGRRWTVSQSTRPFVSAPAEELMSRGFVTGRFGVDREYFGPDADVLLSTVFLNAHCFSLDDDRERDGQIGLRFDPVDDRRVVDIAGTFWVDTTTATLTELDFEYVNLEGPDADGSGGGATFDYLDSGAWIVSEWFIRIPRTGVRGRSNRLSTIGFFDGGGAVTPLPPVDPASGLGTITGTAVDEIREGPLAGATVRVLGTDHETTTDAEGRFRLDGVPAGSRYVALEDPELTRWGVSAPPTPIDIARGSSTEVTLTTPDFEQAAFTLCLDAGIGARTIIVGTVVDRDDRPIRGVRMRLQYEVRHSGGGSLSSASVTTDEFGRYAVCSVPADVRVTLAVRSAGEAWIDVSDFDVREGDVIVRETRVAG